MAKVGVKGVDENLNNDINLKIAHNKLIIKPFIKIQNIRVI